jgi:hypothetical protein
MSRKRFITLLLMTILVFGLCIVLACKTRVIGLVMDPSFTYEAITSGKMAIGGVTSALKSMPERERNLYADMMRRKFLEKRETFIILPAGVVAHLLGHEAYRNMMDEYRTYGRLNNTMKRNLMTKLKTVRYIVFARIEKDNISKSRREVLYDEYGEELENKKTIMEITRSTDVSMNIYDLRTGVIVWSGTVEKISSRSNEYVEKEKSKFFLIALIETIVEIFEPSPEYPEPSSLDELLGRIFTGFAENLPNEK